MHDSVQNALREMHDSTQGRLLAKKMHVIKSQEKRLAKEEAGLVKVPEVEKAIDLSFERKASMAGDKFLFQWRNRQLVREGRVLIPDLAWSLRSRQKVAIKGKNGVGKSSFLKLLLHECQTKTGLKLAYMPQNYEEELNLDQSALDFLASDGEARNQERVRSHLASLQFTRQEIFHEMSDLSGGQLAKVLLLKLVLSQPDLLILDEPTRNLSPLSHGQIVKFFQEFEGSLVCVSHDRRFMDQVCDQVYELTSKGLDLK